jgi:hypothetical protein
MGEWAFYNVVLSLLPVPLIWLALWLINANRNLFLIIRDGQGRHTQSIIGHAKRLGTGEGGRQGARPRRLTDTPGQ